MTTEPRDQPVSTATQPDDRTDDVGTREDGVKTQSSDQGTPDVSVDRGEVDDTVSDSDIQQLEKERAERLDPENRPANAEIDNTQREWDNEAEDFKDNLEGNPPEFDKGDGAGRERDPEIWDRLEKEQSEKTF
jgi:molecular chaperone GrpE (heat shock protein)